MVKVGSYQAKTHLPRLLKRVAGGESIIITRHGEEVARLVPPPHKLRKKTTFAQAVERWRKTRKGLTLGGLKVHDLINEGRR